MKVLVLGGNGMLGHQICISMHKHDVVAVVRTESNALRIMAKKFGTNYVVTSILFSSGEIHRILEMVRPDVVINCCGAVKQHGNHVTEQGYYSINAVFPWRLASACVERGIRLIHISTDCVFDGKMGGYVDSAEHSAVDVYGVTKALGEVTGANVLTLRTSIIGFEVTEITHGLLEWFVRSNSNTLYGYTNAYFSGLTTKALSQEIEYIISNTLLSGLYNIGSEKICKYNLLNLVSDRLDLSRVLIPQAEPHIDRSLISTKYWGQVGRKMPTWDQMAADLRPDLERRARFGLR